MDIEKFIYRPPKTEEPVQYETAQCDTEVDGIPCGMRFYKHETCIILVNAPEEPVDLTGGHWLHNLRGIPCECDYWNDNDDEKK